MTTTDARRSVVLIVDDAVENIAVLGAALRAEYEVQFATSGEQAIELATAAPGPDIILLDVVMPGMDGFTVCRTLKEDERTRFIPIVIMTSLDDARRSREGASRRAPTTSSRSRWTSGSSAPASAPRCARSTASTRSSASSRRRRVPSRTSASASAPSAPAPSVGAVAATAVAATAARRSSGRPLAVRPTLPIEPGTMVGEYRVERQLGAGTFGDVYAGEQPLIGKRVAIKVLQPRASPPTRVMVSRFVAEARAVNQIRHRNIIDIFSFGVLARRRATTS